MFIFHCAASVLWKGITLMDSHNLECSCFFFLLEKKEDLCNVSQAISSFRQDRYGWLYGHVQSHWVSLSEEFYVWINFLILNVKIIFLNKGLHVFYFAVGSSMHSTLVHVIYILWWFEAMSPTDPSILILCSQVVALRSHRPCDLLVVVCHWKQA